MLKYTQLHHSNKPWVLFLVQRNTLTDDDHRLRKLLEGQGACGGDDGLLVDRHSGEGRHLTKPTPGFRLKAACNIYLLEFLFVVCRTRETLARSFFQSYV